MAQARADEIVAAWDALQAVHEARRQAFDLPRLEHEDRAASKAHRAAWKVLAATPAGTMAGVMLKARVMAEIYDDPDDFALVINSRDTTDEALAFSIARDLARLAPSA